MLPYTGTSFAAPMFAGMLCLVQQFFKENAGRTLFQDELYKFCVDHAKDYGAEGHDKYHGHGLLILPDTKDINVEKYLLRGRPEPTPEPTRIVVEMVTGDKVMLVNGVPSLMDVAPFIQNGRTFTPARFVAEALGANVTWEYLGKEIKITIKK